MQICPFCNKEFEESRLNQLYCSDKCRYTHNNRKAREKRLKEKAEYSDTVETVNRILMQNRNLLKKYTGKQITIGQLKQEGFEFSFVTGYKQMQGKKQQTGMVYFCYEYAYRLIDQTTVTIIYRPLEWDADRELLQSK